MAYVETLMAEYKMELWYVVLHLPLAAGEALLEARAARLAPGSGAGYIDRCVLAARAAREAEIRGAYRVISTTEGGAKA